MKKNLLFLLLASGVISASAQSYKTPYYTRSLANDGIKNVIVNTSGGSIMVTGAGQQQPHIDVFVVGNNNQDLSKEEIKKRLEEDYVLDIDIQNGQLKAIAKNRKNNINWRRSLSIGFKVYVNAQTSTNLNTSGGTISIENLNGTQNFETSGGSLSITNVTGNIKGETSGGSISVSNSRNNIDLETSGGGITANNCSGRIKLETSGGSLDLANLKGNVNAETSGGSIRGNNVDGELITSTSGGSINLNAISGSVNASTSGGSVHVQMVKLGRYVKLETSAGHIDLNVPRQAAMNVSLHGDRVNLDVAGNFQGSKDKEDVVGKVNGGGTTVEVHGDGGVTVSSK
ncbi:DUF4097 domain-containing protein [Mucilaginibacter achroorhodeus]|uniref:DUF4097 domain-containing protein n=1 Tax=Mucilaginibacter achroorhodeus TaxID=2599294 RepID=A0A563U3Z1_9SPHI|nr:DUF4097 domain-containing protein [Mucilaginibacter achroorhodeus]TWR26059.1 DUF4097 domain-containing protein [Mucilaginibacter achroorhodeus]